MSIIGISGKSQSGKDLIGKIIQYLTSTKFDNNVEGQKGFYGYFNMTFDKYCLGFTGNSDWQIHKFADAIKDIVCILIGCTREQLESQEFKNSYLGDEWAFAIVDDFYDIIECDENSHEEMNPYTIRQLLQRVGTNAMREKVHENVWVNALFSKYKRFNLKVRIVDCLAINNARRESYLDYPDWIITDVRFLNEAKAIKDRNGIIIRVNREWKWKDKDGNIILKESDPETKALFKPLHISETALDNYEEFDYVIDNNSDIQSLIEQVKAILIKEKII
jgi:hypothetical protein